MKLSSLFITIALIACNGDEEKKSKDKDKDPEPLPIPLMPNEPKDPEPEVSSKKYHLTGARILTATGKIIANGFVTIENGRISNIGEGGGKAPDGAESIDASSKVVTPGLIDTHSHMGVYPNPSTRAHSDGNESVSPTTADVWAEHSFWPQDPSIWRAVAGGITTIQVLPGSANLIGGRSYTAKLRPKISSRQMRFPGAPQGLKMACGENPKRVYGDKGGPKTRMGNVAGYRSAFQAALEYRRTWQKYDRDAAHHKKKIEDAKGDAKKLKELGDPPKMPGRNFEKETLMKLLNGQIFAHIHCYRADEMSIMMDLADEFGFTIKSFHHAVEAYKIAKKLSEKKISASTWADWWGFKMEAFDGVPHNAAMLAKENGIAIIHSDSEDDIRHMNHEAAKAARSGFRMGIKFNEDQILQWITKNAAWAIGIDGQTGTLEKGKMADLIVWNGSPFSIYAHPELVMIDGHIVFDRKKEIFPMSDFETGIRDYGLADGGSKKPKAPLQVDFKEPLKIAEIKDNSFAIKNVQIFDGGILKTTDITIKDGKITALDSTSGYKDVVDGGGRILTPGFIESMAQIGLMEVNAVKSTNDHRFGAGFAPGFLASYGFNPNSVRIAIERAEGVTSTISVPSGGTIQGMGFAFDLTKNASIIDKVAMYGRVGGGSSSRGADWYWLNTLFDDTLLFDKNPKRFEERRLRKLSYAGGHLKAMAPVLNGAFPFVVQANRESDIRALLALKKRFTKLRLVLAGGAEAWTVAKELAAAKIPVLIKPSYQTPFSFEALRVRDDAPMFLADAGVEIIITSADWDSNARRLRQEAGIAVSYGLSREAALKAISETPAKVFGLKDRGKLEIGYKANLVLWSDDPLELFSYPERVWIDGRSQPFNDRQVQLARKYLNK